MQFSLSAKLKLVSMCSTVCYCRLFVVEPDAMFCGTLVGKR